MCLSTVISVHDGQDEVVCSEVSNVAVEGGKITFTDLFGSVTELEGSITNVDLLDGKIFVAV